MICTNENKFLQKFCDRKGYRARTFVQVSDRNCLCHLWTSCWSRSLISWTKLLC